MATIQEQRNAIHSHAAELAESFLNGNLTHVVSELERYGDTTKGLALLAIVLNMLDCDDRDHLEILLVNKAI